MAATLSVSQLCSPARTDPARGKTLDASGSKSDRKMPPARPAAPVGGVTGAKAVGSG